MGKPLSLVSINYSCRISALASGQSVSVVFSINTKNTLATDRLVNDVNACGTIDAAFLPINGRDWVRESNGIIGNMTPQEAALFADMISCTTVFPTHYDMMLGNEESPLVFANYMNLHYQSRAFHFLQLGEPFIMYK